MAVVVDRVSGSTTLPVAYEPDEDWLIQWLAAVEEEEEAQKSRAEPLVMGASLVPGTDIGAVQARWLLSGSLPDLGGAP